MLSPPAASLLTVLLGVLVLAGIVAIARWSRNRTGYPSRVALVLSGASSPLVAGTATFVILRIVWGSFHEAGVVHDERAYLLQAEIFARGRWTAPSPPLAAFFEQMHVFIEPAVFAKSPAGPRADARSRNLAGPARIDAGAHDRHLRRARVLPRETPGQRVDGTPHLVALDHGLANLALVGVGPVRDHERGDVADRGVGNDSLAGLRPQRAPSLGRCRARMGIRSAAADDRHACAAVGLRDPAARGGDGAMESARRACGRGRRHPRARGALESSDPRPLAERSVSGTIPARTFRGTSRASALIRRRRCGPCNRNATVGEWFRDLHARYTFSSVPVAFAERLTSILVWCVDGWRLALGVLILAAALHASGVERAGVATIGLMLLAYLTFAHPPMWIVYYLEVLPIVFFLAAREMGRLLQKLSGVAPEASSLRWPAPVANASLAVALLLLPLGVNDVRRVRAAIDLRNSFHRAADAAIATLPPEKSIVFVSYPPSQSPHVALTRNEPDLASALRWVVYDRGRQTPNCARSPSTVPPIGWTSQRCASSACRSGVRPAQHAQEGWERVRVI